MAGVAREITQRADEVMAGMAALFGALLERIRSCRRHIRALQFQLMQEDLEVLRNSVQQCSDLVESELGHARTSIDTVLIINPHMRQNNDEDADEGYGCEFGACATGSGALQ
jgi:hypothetical protein